MEQNERLELARQLVERTGTNIFLTGKAGTGKTTFLRSLRDSLSKRMVVLAPTGIAAINAEGQTIHSFFQLDFGPFIPGASASGDKRRRNYTFRKDKLRVIRTMDLLVIDEISMVRADLLDSIDDVLRRFRNPALPFGGVQLLMIGDLQQLAPVVRDNEWELLSPYYRSPYFFDSRALAESEYVTVELTKVYRQNEGEFLGILNRIRSNTADARVMERLNTRYIPGFTPPPDTKYVRLTTHNASADRINRDCLDALRGRPYIFEAEVQGTFPEGSYPVPQRLELKKGAQVMFVKNDPSGCREYYNGLIGEVTGLSSGQITVTAADTGRVIEVGRVDWDNVVYGVDPHTGEITEETVGTFSQVPLRHAWAITIHKSQGLTFDHAVIDAANAFAHGQTYVALSRCRTLEGLVLDSPLTPAALITDPMVCDFMNRQNAGIPDMAAVDRMNRAYNIRLLEELFGFDKLRGSFEEYRRHIDTGFSALFPKLAGRYSQMSQRIADEVMEVSRRFRHQFNRMALESGGDITENATLQERIHAGAAYFLERLKDLAALVNDTPLEHDNAETRRRLDICRADLGDIVMLQGRLLNVFRVETFCASDYLRHKAAIYLELDPAARKKREKRDTPRAATRDRKDVTPDEISNPEVYRALRSWRRETAETASVPAFRVMPDRTLKAIAEALPDNITRLRQVPGVGAMMVRRYGEELLGIVASHR